MARECAICAKRGKMVQRYKKLRGKYNPTVKQRQQPNLQWAQVPADVKRQAYKKFAGKRAFMCSKCRRTLLKPK